ncbi:vitamin K epoxide reductase family protein [Actinomarinicola tropica]|uniref:vitamin K epoxide reductase family protein n=1 Tax=Actinomarinicola tropica TaxID=2789776 RepID=UPI0018994489|nr:vitamin K epoxide reductase family protein [Actinomarinicola tropica]
MSELRLTWLLIVAGAVGLVAAFTLLIETIALLEDPSYVPSCSINPILSCGSIMRTDQAEVFGFPNPIIGVAGFMGVVVVGMAMAAGASFRRWFWLGLQAGVTFGVVFVHWLIFQSLYRIDALCPYCMVVWAVMIPLFWYTTLHNADQRIVPVPARVRMLVRTYHGVVLTGWYLIIAGLVAQRFWDYWSSLLST